MWKQQWLSGGGRDREAGSGKVDDSQFPGWKSTDGSLQVQRTLQNQQTTACQSELAGARLGRFWTNSLSKRTCLSLDWFPIPRILPLPLSRSLEDIMNPSLTPVWNSLLITSNCNSSNYWIPFFVLTVTWIESALITVAVFLQELHISTGEQGLCGSGTTSDSGDLFLREWGPRHRSGLSGGWDIYCKRHRNEKVSVRMMKDPSSSPHCLASIRAGSVVSS